ncbi:hypothetical protein ACHAXT_004244 [Thalassiosira profunda]
MDALPSWIPGIGPQPSAPSGQQTLTVDNADGSKTKVRIFDNTFRAPEPPKPTAQTSTIENGDGSKTTVTIMTPPPSASTYATTYPTYPTYPAYPYPYPQPLPTKQGPIVIVLPDVERPKPPTPKPVKPPTPKVVPPPQPKVEKPLPPQKFNSFSIASVVLVALAFVFGVACVGMTSRAYDGYEEGLTDDDEEYVTDRLVAVATGVVATLLFHVATMLIFYAGMKYKSKTKSKKLQGGKKKCCLSTILIAAVVIFGITFVLDLVLLVVAFDGEKLIYPAAVLVALLGSIVAWLLLFGYSEVARRAR